ncbi:MAG: PDZ domain-containing protein, partial [Thiohalocapsa sp.]|nr:PDZ domain-containing protein [Thiohalocapsa sp.]
GVAMRLRPARDAKDAGGVADAFEAVAPVTDIGLRLQPDTTDAVVAVVLHERPAQRGGLSAGDCIIAIDGLRTDRAGAEEQIRRAAIGEPLRIHAFRRDELMELSVVPEPAPADTCELRLLDGPSDAIRRRAAWLGSAG